MAQDYGARPDAYHIAPGRARNAHKRSIINNRRDYVLDVDNVDSASQGGGRPTLINKNGGNMKNIAMEILIAAGASGYNICVTLDGQELYQGTNWSQAWDAVGDAQHPCDVFINTPEGPPTGEWMKIGASGLKPDETVINCADDGGWIDRAWHAINAENESGMWSVDAYGTS